MRFSVDDILKRPNIYFVLILAAGLLWFVSVSLFMLPATNQNLEKTVETSKQISEYCDQIFRLDPARLDYSEIREDVGRFNYVSAVDKVAGKHGIRPAEYNIRTEKVRQYRDGKTQGATVTIEKAGVTELAGFLSELLEIWPDLECENIRLNNKKDEPDTWKVIIKFSYQIS